MHAMTLEEVSRVYDARASIAFDGTTNRKETDDALTLLKQIAPELHSRILDVGCGTGWLLSAAHGAGYRRLFGVDVSARSLRKAATLCQATSVVFILGAINSAAEGAYDAVTAFNACVGCFGPDGDQAFISGIYRALAPGGRAVLSFVGSDAARKRVGTYHVSYGASSEIVTSIVSLDAEERWLVVNQTIGNRPVGEERIAVLTRDRVEELFRAAGFKQVRHTHSDERAGTLPFVDIFSAVKPL